jgi:cyclic pyranopterin phosphate synthase
MTENFCASCNRIRIAADGSLRSCLGGRDRLPLRDLLLAGATDDELEARILAELRRKGERHQMAQGGCSLPSMVGTGG